MRFARGALPYLGMAVLTILSHRTGAQGVPLDLFPHADKVVHAVAFAGLMIAFLLARHPRPWTRRWLLGALTQVGAFAVLDELHQRWVQGRSSDSGDVIADWVGACLVGVWAAWRTGRKPRPGLAGAE